MEGGTLEVDSLRQAHRRLQYSPTNCTTNIHNSNFFDDLLAGFSSLQIYDLVILTSKKKGKLP